MVENITVSEALKYWNRLLRLQIFFPENFEKQNEDKPVFIAMKEICDLHTIGTERGLSALLYEICENWAYAGGNEFKGFPRICSSCFYNLELPKFNLIRTVIFPGVLHIACLLGKILNLFFKPSYGEGLKRKVKRIVTDSQNCRKCVPFSPIPQWSFVLFIIDFLREQNNTLKQCKSEMSNLLKLTSCISLNFKMGRVLW